MKKTAVVRFIGNEQDHVMKYGKTCRRCIMTEHNKNPDCDADGKRNGVRFQFKYGHLYNAYFVEYWEADRINLHVKGEDGEVDYFKKLQEFEIVSDEDNVLNANEAIVRCITHDFDDDFVYITYGKEYRVLGFNKNGAYLVMDDSHMCYFYSPKFFEVIRDDHGILDTEKSHPVYDWKNTHIDSI